MDVTLAQAIGYLTHPRYGKNFYARILASLQKQPDSSIPAMGVTLQNRSYFLLYNEDWIPSVEFEYVTGVVEHEAIHIVMEHIIRGMQMYAKLQTPEERELFFILSPLAVDMAANCVLVHGSDGNQWMKNNKMDEMIMPDKEPFNLPRNKSYEWYMKKLKERAEQDPDFKKMCQAMTGVGGRFHIAGIPHEKWKELMDQLTDEEKVGIAQELQQQTRNIVAQAVEDQIKARGTIPANLEELVKKLLAPPVIPWTQFLRDIVVNTKRFKWVRSVARPNRRHVGVPGLIPFPGRAKDRAFTIAFLVDTSGSMSTKELEMAFNEMQHLQKADPDILMYIIEADVVVHKCYEVGPDDEISPKFHGRGGTSFDYALERARELRPDIVLYYTDGGAPAPRPESRVPCSMLWLITPNGTVPDKNWGMVLKMKDRKVGR